MDEKLVETVARAIGWVATGTEQSSNYLPHAEAAIAAHIAALEQAGFTVVPKRATQHQIAEGRYHSGLLERDIDAVYAAMIAAEKETGDE